MAGTTAYLNASAARLPWMRTGVFQRSSHRFSHSGSRVAVQYEASTMPSPMDGLSFTCPRNSAVARLPRA